MARSRPAAILNPGLGSQRAVRRETPVSPACSPPKRRGDSHPSGKRTWISFTCGLEAPKRHDLVSLAPHPPVCPTSAPFSSASMSGPDIALHLKIPGVAKQEKGRQEVAPNPNGGRAARTRASGQLRCRRAHVSPLPGDLRHRLDTQPRASRSVPSVSRSNPSSAQLQRAGTGRACLVLRSRQPASGARETPGSPACSPPEQGQQSFVRGRTPVSFACGLVAPLRHDLISLAPPSSIPPSRPHFHPLSWL